MTSSPTAQPPQDQASRLRAMAHPQSAQLPNALSPTASASPPHSTPEIHVSAHSTSTSDPRVILICEFPAFQAGFSFAWHIARRVAASGARSAIIDLAPSASRLPAHLETLPGAAAQQAAQHRQPLWSESPHGRGLAAWQLAERAAIDVIAQPAGPYPTAEQMPRICEQLLRAVSGGGRRVQHSLCGWNNLILLSDAQGVPLDEACWQAADAILLLLPPVNHITASVEAALHARLASAAPGQRILALWKQPPYRGGLGWWRRRTNTPMVTPELGIQGVESIPLAWPDEARRGPLSTAAERTLAAAAERVAGHLERIALPV